MAGTVKVPQSNSSAFLGSGDAYRIISAVSAELSLNKATVKASSPGGTDSGASAATDSTGNYKLEKLPSGKTLIIKAAKTAGSATIAVSGLYNSGIARNLDTVSSVVCEKLVGLLTAAKVEALTQDQIDKLETVVKTAIGEAKTIPDLSKSGDASAKFDVILAGSADVKAAFEAVSK